MIDKPPEIAHQSHTQYNTMKYWGVADELFLGVFQLRFILAESQLSRR